jgi:hypothetical protein
VSLIVAIPKSASSALVETLAATHALSVDTRRIRDEVLLRRPIAPGYWHAAQFHRRDFVELDERVAGVLAARDRLAKFHFPPTPRNQAVLQRVPKVILLRDAEEIVSAYRRGEETGAWPTKSYEFAFCFSERGWQQRGRATGLSDELRRFAEGWRAHDGDKLVLESSELIAEPARSLARVEAYLGLPPSGLSALRHERFSRTTATRSVPRMLWRRRMLILRRAIAEANRLVAGDAEWAHRLFESRRKSRAAPIEDAPARQPAR